MYSIKGIDMMMRRLFALCLMMLACHTGALAQSLTSGTLYSTQMRETSALAIFTSQQALSTNQENQAARGTAVSFATAHGAILMTEKYVDVLKQFDGKLGQPLSNLCEAQYRSMYQVAAVEQANKDASTLMRSYTTLRVNSRTEQEQEKMAARVQYYCTKDEESAGLCKRSPNGIQGWDTNYAGAFSVATASPEVEFAGYAYVSNIVDHRPVASLDCKSVACSSASRVQSRRMAFSSLVADTYINQMAQRRVPVLGQ